LSNDTTVYHVAYMYSLIPSHNRILYNRPNQLPPRIRLMSPHHLPRRQLVCPMPRRQLNTLLVILQRLLDDLEQRVRLILIDADVVAHGEDNLADLLLLAAFVVLLVFVEADGDVDAGFGGPGLW
jgi:hypothetical protein